MVNNTKLFKKIYGALIGSAIGDVMGGPVEGLTFEKIKERYDVVDTLLPYGDVPVSAHGPFDTCVGAYTDDSRMSKIFASAIIKKGDVANSNDLALEFTKRYHNAKSQIEKDFLEEYYYKAIYKERKEIFGGQPTNGAIMGIAPYGVINACNVQKAHDDAFEASFMALGYARYATAMAAAAISSAMKENSGVHSIIEDMIKAATNHKTKVEGTAFPTWYMYDDVGRKAENLVLKCVKVAEKYSDIFSVQKELRKTVAQDFFADGAETLAIALAFVTLANGNFERAIIGCVNFGRDNDSSASVAGAITGALCGVDAIPEKWIQTVENANEGPPFESIAQSLYEIVVNNHKQNLHNASLLGKLI